jgi:imidazolonepropionase-like amidohydrolase
LTSSARCLLVRAARIIDGTGAAPLDDATLVISNGRVRAIVASSVARDIEGDIVDLGPRTILPGLIDAHMHLFGVPSDQLHKLPAEREAYRALCAAAQVGKMLQAGITAARCLGSSIGPDVRRAIDDGHIRGPRLKVAGEFICATSGTWDMPGVPLNWMQSTAIIADGVDAVRAAVRQRARSGSDFIKVGLSKGLVGDYYHAWGDDPMKQAPGYSLDEVKALVEEAHRNKLKVSGHCIGDEPVRLALDAGVDIIEHGYGIADDTRRRLVEAKIPVVTTITQLHHHRLAFDPFRYDGRERALFERHTARMRSDFEDGLRAGVRYALGSDLIGPPTHPQWNAATEFALAVEWGMEPMRAIVAGTLVAAEVLGMEDVIGTLEPGKLADFIAVDDNPLDDLRILQRPSYVVFGGEVVADRRHPV